MEETQSPLTQMEFIIFITGATLQIWRINQCIHEITLAAGGLPSSLLLLTCRTNSFHPEFGSSFCWITKIWHGHRINQKFGVYHPVRKCIVRYLSSTGLLGTVSGACKCYQTWPCFSPIIQRNCLCGDTWRHPYQHFQTRTYIDCPFCIFSKLRCPQAVLSFFRRPYHEFKIVSHGMWTVHQCR